MYAAAKAAAQQCLTARTVLVLLILILILIVVLLILVLILVLALLVLVLILILILVLVLVLILVLHDAPQIIILISSGNYKIIICKKVRFYYKSIYFSSTASLMR